MDFSKVAGSKKASKFSNLINAFERTSAAKKTSFDKDETFWYPERDKEGNAKALIRFLPGLASEGEPCFIEKYSHGFKNPTTGQWYIENCPTTIDKSCPVCLGNKQAVEDAGGWDIAAKSVKDLVGRRKRKQQFTCNILVIQDKANPENNGKVFKFNFGKKIHDKIFAKFTPEFDDQDPVNVFDYKDGANFRLSICKVEGYVNYDKSEFDTVSALDDAKIEELKNTQHEILSLISEDKFKPFEELEARFNKVESFTKPIMPSEDVATTTNAMSAMVKSAESFGSEDSEEEDYFKKLAAEVA